MADEQIATDIAAIFDDLFFTELFTHTYNSSSEEIRVIFDNDSTVILNEVETAAPSIQLPTADMAHVTYASTLTRQEDSVVYYPLLIGIDENGITIIYLTKNTK